jgi:hypothetical protein
MADQRMKQALNVEPALSGQRDKIDLSLISNLISDEPVVLFTSTGTTVLHPQNQSTSAPASLFTPNMSDRMDTLFRVLSTPAHHLA